MFLHIAQTIQAIEGNKAADFIMSVSTRISGDIAFVAIDNPPVNAASQTVRQGLLDAVAEIEKSTAQVALLSCAGRTFVAGADVREFGGPPLEPSLPDVLNMIEASSVPWIAAVHGTALGGGLELCLTCSYRIAVVDAKMGLPEVKLGLIPGAGGTVRLPRLVNPVEALKMITGGQPIDAAKAFKIGLIDAIVDNLEDDAECFARSVLGAKRPEALLHRKPVATPDDFAAEVAKITSRAKGQNAVIAAVHAVERALAMSGDAAMKAERATFQELKDDPQSAALRYVFFGERSATKLPQTKGVTPLPLRHIGVVGGGTMGSGIAAACLLVGLKVTMVERDADAADAGAERVTKILDGAVTRGKLTEEGHRAALAAFRADTEYAALASADLVIEAVFEDMQVKADVFATLDAVVPPDAVLATNTSYLDVAALAEYTQIPDRVIGLHFFSPAHVMKLLEVVVPTGASPKVVATGMALGKRLGKIAVPAGVCDGFIGNRIMSAYRQEADYMIADGALPHEVDAAMRDFGFPIGVFQMQDLAGLDIAWAMRKRRAATRDPAERYVTVADQLCEQERFGRKSGRGWYDYSKNPKGEIDSTVTELIEAESAGAGLERATMTSEEIMARILDRMQREGAALLSEGIANSPEAIDVVMINGYGFPRWRGGPMYMSSESI